MKTERRHELQKNDLADYLGKYLLVVQPYLKWVGVAAVVALVALLVGSFVSRRSASSSAQAWEEFFKAQASEDPTRPLEDVAAHYEDASAGLWARQAKANFALNLAADLIYRQRDEADRQLREAVEGFQAVIDQAGSNEFLAQHARYGLAMAYEMQGELKKAREQYEEVIANDDGSALAGQAQDRLDRLKDESIREFYAWFAEQEMTAPQPGTRLPGDLSELPDFPDLSLPAAPPGATPPALPTPPQGGTTPEDTPAAPAEEGAETPAEPTAPATDDAPATEEDPAVETPEESTEPATPEPETNSDEPAAEPAASAPAEEAVP